MQSLLDRCRELQGKGRLPDAIETSTQALTAARAAGDVPGEARSLGLGAILLHLHRERDREAPLFRESAAAWHKLGFGPGEIDALVSLAASVGPGTPPGAEAIRSAAAALAADTTRPRTCVDACIRAVPRIFQPDPRAALPLLEAALKVCEKVEPQSSDAAAVLSLLAQSALPGEGPEISEDYVRRALAIVEKRDPESPHHALLLHNLAVVLTLQVRPADVIPVAEHSLAIYTRLSPENEDLVGSWGLLTQAQESLGLGDRAEEVTRTTLAVIEAHQPGSRYRPVMLEKLGELAEASGKFAAAARSYSTAADLRRNTPAESARVASDLIKAAELSQDYGNAGDADRFLAEALVLCDAPAADPLLRAEGRASQGFIASRRGDHARALALFREALSLRDAAAPGTVGVGDLHRRIGQEARDLGDFETQWRELTLAYSIFNSRNPESTQTVRVTQDLGQIAIDRGDFPLAHRLLERALSIAEDRGVANTVTANLRVDLGNLAAHEGDHEAALGQFEKARAILERCAPSSAALALVLSNIGGTQKNLGRTADAAEILQRAITMFEAAAPESAHLALALNNRAGCLDSLGRKQEAAALRQRALDHWKRTDPTSPVRAHVLLEQARRDRDRGDLASARAHAAEAWDLLRSLGRGVEEDEAREEVTARAQGPAAAILADLLLDDRQPERALEVLERSRAQALWQGLHDGGTRPPGVSDAEWTRYCGARTDRQKANARLAEAWDVRTRTTAAAGSARRHNAAPEVLQRLDREAQEAQFTVERCAAALQDARLRQDREWQAMRRHTAASQPEVDTARDRRDLDRLARSGSTFLYYCIGERSTLLFMLSGQGSTSAPRLSTYRIPLAAAEIARRVRAFTRDLRDRRAEATSRSRELGRLLLPAAVTPAVRRATRLVIVPDGVLWELPFAALTVPEPAMGGAKPGVSATYLGLQKPLCSSYSLALFARGLRAPSPLSHPQVLAVGDPDFSGVASTVASSGLPAIRGVDPVLPVPTRLPGTRVDAEHVAQLYGATPLLGARATEKEVRHQLVSADVVHLATHGWAHPYWADGSRVYLAAPAVHEGSADPADDGMLEAWEIAGQLELHADLVVLAACETDLGTVVPWEGVNGLTRSLLRAGAHSVVASHWEVRDDSTRALMLEFHRGIRAGLAKDEALRQAMRAVWQRPDWRHPYFWAPFALTGDRENHLFVRSVAAPAHRR